MQKSWIIGLGAILLAGCNPVTDAGAGDAINPAPPTKPPLNAGNTTNKTNNFVGEFGTKTREKGMQVKFGAEGTVTVDGQSTTAIGTYSPVGDQAEATFNKTNVARFNQVKFDLSKDGKTLRFLGPLATTVTLQRTQ